MYIINNSNMQNSEEKKLHENYYIKSDNSNASRYKWYKEKYFNNIKGKKILEIGCGDGGVVQFLKNENEVYAVDISKNAMKFLKAKGIKPFLADVSKENLPFEDSIFDIVIALEVLEHLKSPQYAIEEIQRVLKQNGRFICSIPNPRTGHKLLYPCLFKFRNFKKYLSNNRFSILSETTYGICPPFWNQFRSFINKKWKKEKQKLNQKGSSEQIPFLTKVARFMSSDLISIIKPKIFGWSFVYETLNSNPSGAKKIYKEIVEETKGAYD